MDGLLPDCQTAAGCLIPPLDPGTSQVLDIRDKLIRLKNMGIGDSILKLYGATVDTLELLAIAEDELNPQHEDMSDGNGSDMAAECQG